MNKFKAAGLWIVVKVMATLVFLATSVSSCGVVYFGSQAVFYPEQTTFPNGIPPAAFAVVFENRSAKGSADPFGVTRWEKATEMIAKDGPGSFRLSRKTFRSQDGDLLNFDVLEETPDIQVIEMTHANTGTVKTRYRIEGKRITPLLYKTDGGVALTMLLLPVFVFCLWLGLVAARRFAPWFSRLLGIEPAAASAGSLPVQRAREKPSRWQWLYYVVVSLVLLLLIYALGF